MKNNIIIGSIIIAIAVFFSMSVSIAVIDGEQFESLNLSILPAGDGLKIIDYEHYEIHEGEHFYICNYDLLGNGGVLTFTVTTPNTDKLAHMVFEVQGTQAFTFEIKEGAIPNVLGTSATPFNNYRDSNKTSNLVVRKGDTFTNEGNLIFDSYNGEKNVAGIVARNREIILKSNTSYIFRMTNEVTTDNYISYCGEWYEHEFT